jgi:hypothetical protein
MEVQRGWPWLLLALILGTVVWYNNPADLGVVAYKFCVLSLAGTFGFLMDRTFFPYGRPDKLVDLTTDGWTPGESIAFFGACLRRAIIIAAFICGSSGVG